MGCLVISRGLLLAGPHDWRDWDPEGPVVGGRGVAHGAIAEGRSCDQQEPGSYWYIEGTWASFSVSIYPHRRWGGQCPVSLMNQKGMKT